MTKAIIFDLNGVFIKSEKLSDRFARDFDVSQSKFMPALESILDIVRRPGAGDLYSYWISHLTDWGINLNRQEFYDYWFGAEKEDKEIINLAMNLKDKGIKIIILSNNFKERTEYYLKNFQFLKILPDKIYFSWQTGFLKSDPRAYQQVLLENNLKPEEVMFFDDSDKNTEVAKSLGIVARKFDGLSSVVL